MMAEIYCPVCGRNQGDDRFLPDGFTCAACGYTDVVGSDAPAAPVESDPTPESDAPVEVDPSAVTES